MSERRVCAITGAGAGIGKAVATELARRGDRVLLLVREGDKAKRAGEEIRAASGNEEVHLRFVDLASLASVRAAADGLAEEERLDVLINNAGVYKRRFAASAEGHELTVAVNYLAPFLLTNLLLPKLEASGAGRVVNVVSAMYPRGDDDLDAALAPARFRGDRAYATSKKLLVLFTLALAARLGERGRVTANCVHPGVAGSEIFREYPRLLARVINLFVKSPEQCTGPELHLATAPELAGVSGRYFHELEERPLDRIDASPDRLDRLWARSAEVVGLG